MEFVIIWLLFGLITGVAANSKGRSGCGWFLLGFLLGPFGLLLIVFTPKINENNSDRVKEDPVDSEDCVSCPDCAEQIKKQAVVCKHCGKKFNMPVEKFIRDGYK